MPHFDQGHEEYNLLGSQSWTIIKLLLQFTGGISNGVLEVGPSAPSHSGVSGSWRSRLVPHRRWRSAGTVSSMSGKTRHVEPYTGKEKAMNSKGDRYGMTKISACVLAAALLAATALVWPEPAMADDVQDARQLVEKARLAFDNFMVDQHPLGLQFGRSSSGPRGC